MGQFTTTVWKGTYAYLMGGSEADDWLLKIGKYEPNLPQLGNANCIVETNRPAQCMLVEIARSLVNTDYGDVFTGLFQGAGEPPRYDMETLPILRQLEGYMRVMATGTGLHVKFLGNQYWMSLVQKNVTIPEIFSDLERELLQFPEMQKTVRFNKPK